MIKIKFSLNVCHIVGLEVLHKMFVSNVFSKFYIFKNTEMCEQEIEVTKFIAFIAEHT